MFVKIMRYLEEEDFKGVSNSHGNAKERIVPTENLIFEAEGVNYGKVAVDSLEEFHEKTANIETVHIVTPIPTDGPFEFIQIKMMDKTDDGTWMVTETLIGSDCNLFVMNELGKTIERLSCLGRFTN